MAAQLRAALANSHVDLAQVIALRTSAWIQQAAATLPPAWRDNYLSRARMLQRLQPARPREELLPPARHGALPGA